MNDSVIDIFSLCRFFFKFGGNLTGRWYLHSPPSGKEGGAEIRGGRWIHNVDNNRLTHSPTTSPYGYSSFPKEENGEWRILSTIKLLFS